MCHKKTETASPISYQVVKELFNENVQPGKKIVEVESLYKAVNDQDKADLNLPYAGYKTHEEEAYPGDLFLAFRCTKGTPALCAQLPYE